MRARQPADWARDLGGRHDLEAEVERTLDAHPELQLLHCSTSSMDRLDFQIACYGQFAELELKSKNQPLSLGWQRLRPEVRPEDLFVLDELALRKIIDAGRYAFLLVRDKPRQRWCFWSTGDLLVASRTRHARALDTPAHKIKGKLLFDLSEAGHVGTSLDGALDALVSQLASVDQWWHDIAPWPSTRSRSL